MPEQQSSYRQIMKAISIFGGVQVFTIIILLIKSKFIAVLLGTTGMGILGLLSSTTSLIGALTSFGLRTSAVKDVAAANSSGDEDQISRTIAVCRRLVFLTGLLGMVLTLILAPWLSKLTFGNDHYTMAFVWISCTVLFAQLTNGQLVILQGLRKLSYLAQANLYGNVLGLFITVPFYFWWGVDGIVPGLIGISLVSLLFAWFYAHKITIKPIQLSTKETLITGKEMLRLGFFISLSGLLAIGISYIVRIFINRTGSVDDVGLYNAGFTIIGTYVGLIFNAMGTDYYPRLAAVSKDNAASRQVINQQAEIAILILAPILIVFLVFINWIVVLIYSKQFLPINGMIYWAALGMFFKAAGWAAGFLILAKGDGKLFFFSESLFNLYICITGIIGYYYWGLTGLGISFLISFFLYLVQVYWICSSKFEFYYDRSFWIIFGLQLMLALLGFLTITFLPNPYTYLVGCVLIAISSCYSFIELDKRIGIKNLMKRKK